MLTIFKWRHEKCLKALLQGTPHSPRRRERFSCVLAYSVDFLFRNFISPERLWRLREAGPWSLASASIPSQPPAASAELISYLLAGGCAPLKLGPASRRRGAAPAQPQPETRPEAAESLGSAGPHLSYWISVLEKTKVKTGRFTAPGTSPARRGGAWR